MGFERSDQAVATVERDARIDEPNGTIARDGDTIGRDGSVNTSGVVHDADSRRELRQIFQRSHDRKRRRLLDACRRLLRRSPIPWPARSDRRGCSGCVGSVAMISRRLGCFRPANLRVSTALAVDISCTLTSTLRSACQARQLLPHDPWDSSSSNRMPAMFAPGSMPAPRRRRRSRSSISLSRPMVEISCAFKLSPQREQLVAARRRRGRARLFRRLFVGALSP